MKRLREQDSLPCDALCCRGELQTDDLSRPTNRGWTTRYYFKPFKYIGRGLPSRTLAEQKASMPMTGSGNTCDLLLKSGWQSCEAPGHLQ